MPNNILPIQVCDCGCHRTGAACAEECCEGQCPNCGRYFAVGLAAHLGQCGGMLSRVPPKVMRKFAANLEKSRG